MIITHYFNLATPAARRFLVAWIERNAPAAVIIKGQRATVRP